MNFYQKLESVANERGVSVYRIFADLGLSRGIMSALKSGKTKSVSAKTLKAVANYLGVSTDYIINYGEEQSVATPNSDSTDTSLESFMVAMYNEGKELNQEQKNLLIRLAREMQNRKD